jgi:hypothetical protein
MYMQENSFTAVQASGLPAENIPPISLDRFCEITGLSPVSAWRYQKRGWLKTHLIANRRYILAADVAEFNRRIASGEFAGKPGNPSVARHAATEKGGEK